MNLLLLALAPLWGMTPLSDPPLTVSHVFDSNMVIQRDQPIHVWGTATPGENVRVRFGPRDTTVRADENGDWSARLEGLPASGQAHVLSVRSGDQRVKYDNIVIGDVWLLGGQSNMEDVLEDIYHGDTEVAAANYPLIRLMTVPQVAGNQPLHEMSRINEFNSWTNRYEQKGSWHPCTPESVRRFSAIGYVFGRRLHQVSGVPIGLIDASWGGTTVEAWTSRGMLASLPAARPLTDQWDARIAAYDPEESLRQRVADWERDTRRRKERGEPANPRPTEPDQDPATDRNNPGAAFNGMIAPLAGFNIKGAIFNQGYNNALGNARPGLYTQTINGMIRDWRNAFGDESLPFGIVGLTAGGEPQTLENFEIRMVDAGPFIREAQARAMQDLDQVGFVPAYDQQVPWYHPHKKFELGERIARWALCTGYGQEQLGWQPAVCTGSALGEGQIVLQFDRPVRTHDGRPFAGFAIAGQDRHFHPATAEFLVVGQDEHGRDRLDESQLVVSHPLVPDPQAVRYAWARNPHANAVNSRHHERTIPVVSFRTDDWDWPEAPFEADGGEAHQAHRQAINEIRDKARQNNRQRLVDEARHRIESMDQ